MEQAEVPAPGRGGTQTTGGARDGLEAAYKDRSGELIAWAARRTGSREDAEDLLHDAFASALKGIGRLELAADPMGWLFTNLRNKVVDLWRKRSRRQEYGTSRVAVEAVQEIVAATGFGPAEQFEREDLCAALNDAIAALPKEQRLVIEAQVFEGLTFRMIAEHTGLSIDTLTARKSYAVKKITRALRAWFED
ncbi:MAG: sigma-70 family RNA polymerase sigma factor [Spirochaetota bacterium]